MRAGVSDVDVRNLVLLGGAGVVLSEDGGEHVSALLSEGFGSGDRVLHDIDALPDGLEFRDVVEELRAERALSTGDGLLSAAAAAAAAAADGMPAVQRRGPALQNDGAGADACAQRTGFMRDLLLSMVIDPVITPSLDLSAVAQAGSSSR